MKLIKLLAILLLVTGVLVLVYGSFSYTKKSQAAKLGSLTLTVAEKQTVYVPIWVGIGALVIGGGILLYPQKKKTS